MKRTLLASIACLTLLAALPAISAAHSSGHDRGRHDRPEDRAGHRERAGEHHPTDHVRRLQHFRPSGSAEALGSAGTVQSFSNGLLTIKLAHNATVSGMVASDTRISCEVDERDFSSRDGGGGSDDRGDRGDRGADEPTCPAGLRAGTTVREAELIVSGARATWQEIELELAHP